MKSRAAHWSIWANFIGYQIVWLAAVMGAGRGVAWPGIVAAVTFATWRFAVGYERALNLRLIAVALACGALIDGVAASEHLIHYAASSPALPPGGAPLWILALWSAFALTLTRSLAWLSGRAWLAALLGAFGAPAAYLSAARGWHAVALAPPEWRGLLWLAAGWAAATAALAALLTRGLRAGTPAGLWCQSSSP